MAALTLSNVLDPDCSRGISSADHGLWHPPTPFQYTQTQQARERERESRREEGREGEMHPTLELVYTQRICNYSVCLKCPKFLCKMEHLNRHHASAPATNCSAHQPQTEFVKFISIRCCCMCLFHSQLFKGFTVLTVSVFLWARMATFYFRGLLWPNFEKNIIWSSITYSPLHFNCIHQI